MSSRNRKSVAKSAAPNKANEVNFNATSAQIVAKSNIPDDRERIKINISKWALFISILAIIGTGINTYINYANNERQNQRLDEQGAANIQVKDVHFSYAKEYTKDTINFGYAVDKVYDQDKLFLLCRLELIDSLHRPVRNISNCFTKSELQHEAERNGLTGSFSFLKIFNINFSLINTGKEGANNIEVETRLKFFDNTKTKDSSYKSSVPFIAGGSETLGDFFFRRDPNIILPDSIGLIVKLTFTDYHNNKQERGPFYSMWNSNHPNMFEISRPF